MVAIVVSRRAKVTMLVSAQEFGHEDSEWQESNLMFEVGQEGACAEHPCRYCLSLPPLVRCFPNIYYTASLIPRETIDVELRLLHPFQSSI